MSVARHTAYNIAGSLVPVAVSLATVPIYLKTIGLDRYGILAICWLLIGYFTLFDFGLGRAITQKVASLSEAPPGERNRIFWTGAIVSGGLAGVAAFLVQPAAKYGLSSMKLRDPSLRPEIDGALPFLVAAVPIGIGISLLLGALEGRRAFLRINLITSVGTIAATILPFIAARVYGPSLPHLLTAALLSRMGVFLVLAVCCVRVLPVQRPELARASDIRKMLHFGSWTTVSNIVGPILVFIDRFAIGAVLSSAALAIYVVPFNFVSQLLVIPASLASALMPRLAAAPKEQSAPLSQSALRTVAFFVTPMTLSMLVLIGPFLKAWIPMTATASIPVGYLFLFGFWANSVARVSFVHLEAQGRPDLAAKLHILEIVPYLIALYFGMKLLGLPGAALAWSTRAAVDAVSLFLIDKVPAKTLGPLAAQACLIIAGTSIMFFTPVVGPARLLSLSVLVAVTVAFTISNIPLEARQMLKQMRCRLIGDTV